MYQGDIEDLSIICPWHQFRFSLLDGTSPDCDQKSLIYQCKIMNDSVYVHLPKDYVLKEVEWISQLDSASVVVDLCPNLKASCPSSSLSTLHDWACLILNTSNPSEKVALTYKVSEKWHQEHLEIGHGPTQDKPAREDHLTFSKPQAMHKRGGGGTLESRLRILHALANIEQWAIDLAWDIVARFTHMPREFYSDFIKVACDEAKHFTFLENRLKELGSCYGAYPVHGSLWESATETSHDLLSRLAIVHMYGIHFQN